jgi:hypothetical protein
MQAANILTVPKRRNRSKFLKEKTCPGIYERDI